MIRAGTESLIVRVPEMSLRQMGWLIAVSGMVRPDRITLSSQSGSRYIDLAGESPVVVSAGAPRSRHRVTKETLASEWCVKSP